MRVAAVLWLAAGTSLAFNAYSVVGHGFDEAHEEPVGVVCPPATAPRRLHGTCERTLGECLHSNTQCQALVDDCGQPAASELSLSERYASGEPNLDLTARIQSPIARVREAFPDSRLRVDCRADVCEILIERDPDTVLDELMSSVQAGLADLMTGASFEPRELDEAGIPKQMQMLLAARRADQTPGMGLLIEIERRFLSAGALRDCHAQHRDSGTFDVALDLEPDENIVVHSGGSLGATPTGRCLLDALDRAIEEVEIPPRHTGARRYLVLDVPAPDSVAE